jgi:hypothetical protein
MSSAVTSWGTEGPGLLSEPPAVARFGLEGQDALLSTYILRVYDRCSVSGADSGKEVFALVGFHFGFPGKLRWSQRATICP